MLPRLALSNPSVVVVALPCTAVSIAMAGVQGIVGA